MKISSSILILSPLEERERFERVAKEIVCESFVFTGDRDYITARFAFFQKQPHLFMWSAAQALEKYLKANILLLGSEAVSKVHKHSSLGGDLKKIDPERLHIELDMPSDWAELGITFWRKQDVDKFLKRIDQLGAPDVRYDQTQLEVNLQDLVFLDRLAFRLRHDLIHEQVEDCKYVGEQLKRCFFDLNYSFAPAEHQHPGLLGLLSFKAIVPALEAALKGAYGHAAIYQEWAKQSLKLNEKQIARLSSRSVDT